MTLVSQNVLLFNYRNFNGGNMKINKLVLLSIISPILFSCSANVRPFAEKHSIIINSDDNKYYSTLNLIEGDEIILPSLTKEGYNFDGWYYYGTDSKFELKTMPSRNITIQARWAQSIQSLKLKLQDISLSYHKNNLPIYKKVIGKSTFETDFDYLYFEDKIYVDHRQIYIDGIYRIETGVRSTSKFGDLKSGNLNFYYAYYVSGRVERFASIDVYNLVNNTYDTMSFNYNVKSNYVYDTSSELEKAIKDIIRDAFFNVNSQLLINHEIFDYKKLWEKNN
jgi:uncharacterized repeat protein (TIGR02543 family)